jgi:CheY-like chemotaxis protein
MPGLGERELNGRGPHEVGDRLSSPDGFPHPLRTDSGAATAGSHAAGEASAETNAPAPHSVPRILCVDDEPAMLKILKRALEGEFEIVTANDPVKALVMLENGADFSVVISDMKMPQMDGAEFLSRVRRLAPKSTRLALTACLERELSPDEVFGILTKPCPLNLLTASVQAAVEHHALQALLRPSQEPPPGLERLGSERHANRRPRTASQSADGGLPTPRARLDSELPPHLALPIDLELPGLSFDPWIETSALRAPSGAPGAPHLSMLAGVAEKFFRLGQAREAERLLRPVLWDVLQRCESDRHPPERDVELAGQLAIRLAAANRSAGWIDYLFRVFTAVSRPLSADVIEGLHDLMRRIHGVSHGGFVRYLSALRARRHEFGPGEHFLYRRIEGLEPLLLP